MRWPHARTTERQCWRSVAVADDRPCPQYREAIRGSATATIWQAIPPCAHSGPGCAPRTRRPATRCAPDEHTGGGTAAGPDPAARAAALRAPRGVDATQPHARLANLERIPVDGPWGPRERRPAVAPSSVSRTTPTRSTSQCATRSAADPMATATAARTSVLAITHTERFPRRRVRRIFAPSNPCLPDGAPPVGRRRPNSTPDDRAHRSRAGEVLRERGTSASVL